MLLKGFEKYENESNGNLWHPISNYSRRTRLPRLCRISCSSLQCRRIRAITAATLRTPENLRNEIRKVRKLTNKPFGVNFAIARYNGKYEELLEVAIEEKVPAISITGGNPQPVLERLKGSTIKKLVLVSGVDTHKKLNNLVQMLLWLLDKKVVVV